MTTKAAPPHSAEVTVPKPGTRQTDAKGVPMVYVPAGKFLMGSAPKQVDDAFGVGKKDFPGFLKEWVSVELPQHEVVISQPFWLDLYPVTNALFARFIHEGGYRRRELWTEIGWEWVQRYTRGKPNDYEGATDNLQPRVGITWFEARAFARWRDVRLPTEAEWEWAARGPKNSSYPWGETLDFDRVVFGKNTKKPAMVSDSVRLNGASWCGALDMSGNVWEWCSSLYQPYPYKADDGREQENATGDRILRGGSCSGFSVYLRSASRFHYFPDEDLNGLVGVRCVRSATPTANPRPAAMLQPVPPSTAPISSPKGK